VGRRAGPGMIGASARRFIAGSMWRA